MLYSVTQSTCVLLICTAPNMEPRNVYQLCNQRAMLIYCHPVNLCTINWYYKLPGNVYQVLSPSEPVYYKLVLKPKYRTKKCISG